MVVADTPVVGTPAGITSPVRAAVLPVNGPLPFANTVPGEKLTRNGSDGGVRSPQTGYQHATATQAQTSAAVKNWVPYRQRQGTQPDAVSRKHSA